MAGRTERLAVGVVEPGDIRAGRADALGETAPTTRVETSGSLRSALRDVSVTLSVRPAAVEQLGQVTLARAGEL